MTHGDGAAEERLGNDPTSELWGEHRTRYRFAAERLKGKRVLDLACGAGFGLTMLRQAGARPFGMDLEWAALTESRSIAAQVPVAAGDAGKLPLPDRGLDAIVSFETIEHVPDAAQVVAEYARVLAADGELILSTPNRAFGPDELHQNNPFHIQEFTAAELRSLLEVSFAKVEIYGQWVKPEYRYVPFLMVEQDRSPMALAWKAQTRLPYRVRDGLARFIGGRPFYPTEWDYEFLPGRTDGAHTLLAVASQPK